MLVRLLNVWSFIDGALNALDVDGGLQVVGGRGRQVKQGLMVFYLALSLYSQVLSILPHPFLALLYLVFVVSGALSIEN
jgi:hypothetical protein